MLAVCSAASVPVTLPDSVADVELAAEAAYVVTADLAAFSTLNKHRSRVTKRYNILFLFIVLYCLDITVN